MALYSRKHCTGQNFDFAWTEFAKFEICYILTIGTENNDFCLILGARCVAIGLYVMLEDHESCRVRFLKPDSLKNFGHTTNATMRLMFLHSKCYLLCISLFYCDFLSRAWHFFERRAQGWFHGWEKTGFFLEFSFFGDQFATKTQKSPKSQFTHIWPYQWVLALCAGPEIAGNL